MSTILVLKPRGEMGDREVINQYYDYVLEKVADMTAPHSGEDIERIESRRKTSLEQYGVKPDSPHIFEYVMGDYAAAPSYDDFTEIFPLAGDAESRTVCKPEQLRRASEILQQMKRELMEMGGDPERNDGIEYTPEERAWEMETGVIALCEFAAEHGHCVAIT